VAESAVTQELIAWRRGDAEAARRVFALVYDELRVIAGRQRGGGRPQQTLTTTALVHEAFLKLAHHERLELEDRRHFLCTAARAMRQILVDHARRRSALKRGGGMHHSDLDEDLPAVVPETGHLDLDALDRALDRLAASDARLVQIVEMRFFAGLSLDEMAELLGVSESTLKRDWRKARAFLFRELKGDRA
jgi:RNA polymerase sigma factor (TIGR02999 family)